MISVLFMSLIATCKLMGVNPFAYLTALLRHPDKILESPSRWMPSWALRKSSLSS